jgi:hypothetical protein
MSTPRTSYVQAYTFNAALRAPYDSLRVCRMGARLWCWRRCLGWGGGDEAAVVRCHRGFRTRSVWFVPGCPRGARLRPSVLCCAVLAVLCCAVCGPMSVLRTCTFSSNKGARRSSLQRRRGGLAPSESSSGWGLTATCTSWCGLDIACDYYNNPPLATPSVACRGRSATRASGLDPWHVCSTPRLGYPQTGENALMKAAMWGHLDAVQTLLELGLDPNYAKEVGVCVSVRGVSAQSCRCLHPRGLPP